MNIYISFILVSDNNLLKANVLALSTHVFSDLLVNGLFRGVLKSNVLALSTQCIQRSIGQWPFQRCVSVVD